MKPIITRTVTRNGISYGNNSYYHVGLLPYRGTKVIVQKRKNGLEVSDPHGRHICMATAVTFSQEEPAKETSHA